MRLDDFNVSSIKTAICISSCIGKLFCSILNQRLLKHVDLNNILHKSQIGFLANNRTADHVLTLRTLIDKYVHCHKEKIYACFVDFRKAFDSVWHDGLLYKLSKINVQGKFYSLIKSLYSKSTCSVRIGNNKTRSFQYARGVRQGCILSPLLFNLYLNDLAFSFDNVLSDPFVLPNGTRLNSLLYADDLIIGNLRWRRFLGDGDRTGRESLELRQPSLPVKNRTLRSQWTQKDGAFNWKNTKEENMALHKGLRE